MTAALERGEWSVALHGRTLPSGADPVPILQEAGWALGLVWMSGIYRPSRDSIPDRSARSHSLYLLNYRATHVYSKGKGAGHLITGHESPEEGRDIFPLLL